MLESKLGEIGREDEVFFSMLSDDAQKKILDLKGISDPREAFLDVFPLVTVCGSVSEYSPQELEDAAMLQLGFYSLAA